MLVQSQEGVIKLLPALPDEWAEGKYSGVCVRGAFELDFAWKDKQVTQLKILSKAGVTCRIESRPKLKISSNGQKVKYRVLPNGLVEFDTVKGGVYIVE